MKKYSSSKISAGLKDIEHFVAARRNCQTEINRPLLCAHRLISKSVVKELSGFLAGVLQSVRINSALVGAVFSKDKRNNGSGSQ
jgi:hypothetical protein